MSGRTFVVAPTLQRAHLICRLERVNPHGRDTELLLRPRQVDGLRFTAEDTLLEAGWVKGDYSERYGDVVAAVRCALARGPEQPQRKVVET